MNTLIKRSVATLLTAGMLLTGFTACNDKTPEEKAETSFVSSSSKDANIDFDYILYASTYYENNDDFLALAAYKKPSEGSTEKGQFYKIIYNIDSAEVDEFRRIAGTYETTFPFNNEMYGFFSEIIKNYEPISAEPTTFSGKGQQLMDSLVEEYVK